MECSNCGKALKPKQRRFCSSSCSAQSGNRTREPVSWSQEQKDLLSAQMKAKYDSDPEYALRIAQANRKRAAEQPERFARGERLALAVGQAVRGKNPIPTSLLDVSARTVRKVLQRLGIGCSRCGWSEGVGDLHHIRGRKVEDANGHHNLAYICPNCHRLVHEHKVLPEELVSLETQVGHSWLTHYFG